MMIGKGNIHKNSPGVSLHSEKCTFPEKIKSTAKGIKSIGVSTPTIMVGGTITLVIKRVRKKWHLAL